MKGVDKYNSSWKILFMLNERKFHPIRNSRYHCVTIRIGLYHFSHESFFIIRAIISL